MYIHAIGISGAFLIITEMLPDEFSRPVGIVLSIVLGLLGNKLYCDYSQKEIIKIKNNLPDLREQEKAIANKGGTNLLFAIIFTAVYLGIVIIWEVIKS